MSNPSKMFSFYVKLFIIYGFCVYLIDAKISDKRLCASEDCSAPISKAKTLMNYGSPESGILSFKSNEEVTIYSKSAGSRMDLWGVKIGNRRGYIPITHLREFKVLVKESELNYTVDTEKIEVDKTKDVPSKTKKNEVPQVISPDSVKQPFEIVDGTKILQNYYDDTSTEPSLTDQVLSSSGNNKDVKTKPLDKVGQMRQFQDEVPTDSKISESVKSNDDGIVDKIVNIMSNFINDENTSKEDLNESDDEDDDEEDDDEEEGKINNVTPMSNQLPPTEESITKSEVDKSSEETSKLVSEAPISTKDSAQVSDETNKLENIDVKDPTSTSKTSESSASNKRSAEELVTEPKHTEKLLNNHLEKHSNKPDTFNQLSSDNLLPLLVDKVNIVNTAPQDSNKKSVEETVKEPQHTTEKLLEKSEIHSAEQIKIGDENRVSQDSSTESSFEQPKIDVTGGKESIRNENIENNQFSDNLLQSSEVLNDSNVSLETTNEENIQLSFNVENNTELHNNIENYVENSSEKLENQAEALSSEESKENPSLSDTTVFNETQSSTQFPNSKNVEETHDKKEYISEGKTENSVEISMNEAQNDSFNEGQVEQEQIFQQHQGLQQESSLLVDNSNIISDVEITPKNEGDHVNNDGHSSKQERINGDLHFEDAITVNPLNSEEPAPVDEAVTPSWQEKDSNVEQHNQIENSEIENHSHSADEPTLISEQSETASIRNIMWGSSTLKNEAEDVHVETNAGGIDDSLLSRQPQDQFSCSSNPSSPECNMYQETLNAEELSDTVDILTESIFSQLFPIREAFVVLFVTAVTIVLFLWGFMLIEKFRKESLLINQINSLEKSFLILQKENEILSDKLDSLEGESIESSNRESSDAIRSLKQELDEAHNTCNSMEQQIHSLEKELSNSTEVGLELNRMLTDFLSSEKGSEALISNVEQLQRQLIEKQDIINSSNESLAIKETENHELRLELDICNTKVTDLQAEVNKMALNLLKAEEDKEQLQTNSESEIASLKNQLQSASDSFKTEKNKLIEEMKHLEANYKQTQSELELKISEYALLKESVAQLDKMSSNGESTYLNLVDMTSAKAELMQLRKEKQILTQSLQQENESKLGYEKQVLAAHEDFQNLKIKYNDAERQKVEAQTKLEVLSNYFKDKEAQLQRDLNKQESMWIEKQGEATSTIERFKYLQEELKNYKAQFESLKQELVAQEVDMKSQISMLENKAHENWVAARQAERKLDEAKQDAAQLRNRLTLRERSFNDEKTRMQSPLEQNGDSQISPMHVTGGDVYNARDHLTKSPLPLSSLPPPPFMPPPPGVPHFVPPPPGGVPLGFLPPPLPPPSSMLPVDHRPPPLGRMSSPPVNSRYSPDSRYSPFNRHRDSPSPTSDEDYDRDRSPPPPHRPVYRGYSPYREEDRHKDFNRGHHPPPPPPNLNKRQNKGSKNYNSSGSAHSNESLEKINRYNSKV